jgi:formate dehydrogenase maturation protein FdhE
MNQAEWDRRIGRAHDLISSYPFAAEGLRFYARIAAFQRSLYGDCQRALAAGAAGFGSLSLRGELDLFFLLPKFSDFLPLLQQISPPPLAQVARELARKGPAEWQRVIEEFWREEPLARDGGEKDVSGEAHGTIARERLLAWIFLQPYAEYLADQCETLHVEGTPSTCPICGGNPVVGVLRREGDGAKKSLICMLCSHEWSFRRIYCPACGEEREPQMGFYSAPEIAHVRVDVCDTCHTYLKSIDLTKTGLAVPIVDELATLPLDLWAREHGYEKLQINLLGS